MPLPRNRLLVLTLVGALASAGAAIALASPGLLVPARPGVASNATAQDAATEGAAGESGSGAMVPAPALDMHSLEREREAAKDAWEAQRESAGVHDS